MNWQRDRWVMLMVAITVVAMYPATRGLRKPPCQPIFAACRAHMRSPDGPGSGFYQKRCVLRVLETGGIKHESFDTVLLEACREHVQKQQSTRDAED